MINREITLVPNILHKLIDSAARPILNGQNATDSFGQALADGDQVPDIMDGNRKVIVAVDTSGQGDDMAPNNNAAADKRTEADAVTGWTGINITLTSVTSLNDIVPLFGTYMLRALSVATGHIRTTFTSIAGQSYTIVMWLFVDASETAVLKLTAGTSGGGSQLGTTLIPEYGRWQRVELHFKATGTTTHISISPISNTINLLMDMAYVTDGDFRFDLGVESLADFAPDTLIVDGHNFAEATELITNGDSEAAVPTFNGGAMNVNRGSLAQDTTRANGGATSTKMTSDGTAGAHGVILNDVAPFGPGSVIQIAVDVFIPSTNTSIIDIGFAYTSPGGTQNELDFTDTMGEWVGLSMIYVVPNDNAITEPMLLWHSASKTTTEAFFFDNLSFKVMAPVSLRKHEVDDVDTATLVTIDRAYGGELGESLIEMARHVSSLMVEDASSNKLDLQGGIWPELGFDSIKGIQYAKFNGINQHLTRADNDVLDFGLSNFSLEVFLFTNSATVKQRIASHFGGTGWVWHINDTADGDVELTIVDGVTLNFRTAGAEIEANTWYHIVAVIDQANQIGKIYINGVDTALSEDDSASLGSLDLLPADNFELGTTEGASAQFWDGGIALFRPWALALTSDEVTALYNSGAPAGVPTVDQWGNATPLVTGTDNTFAGAGNWTGANLGTFDVNSTVAGKAYMLGDGGSDFMTLANVFTVGEKHLIILRARLNAGASTLIRAGSSLTAANTDEHIEFTPAGAEGTFSGFIENPTGTGLFIGRPSADSGFSGIAFEIDDVTVIRAGAIAEWDFRSVGNVALPHKDDLLYCELENSDIDLWYNLLVEAAGFDWQADAEVGYIALGKGFSLNKILKGSFRSGPAFPGIFKRDSTGGVPKAFRRYGERQNFAWTYGGLTDTEKTQLEDVFRLSDQGLFPTYMKIVEDSGAPKVHKLFFNQFLPVERKGGRWNVAVSFTEYPR